MLIALFLSVVSAQQTCSFDLPIPVVAPVFLNGTQSVQCPPYPAAIQSFQCSSTMCSFGVCQLVRLFSGKNVTVQDNTMVYDSPFGSVSVPGTFGSALDLSVAYVMSTQPQLSLASVSISYQYSASIPVFVRFAYRYYSPNLGNGNVVNIRVKDSSEVINGVGLLF